MDAAYLDPFQEYHTQESETISMPILQLCAKLMDVVFKSRFGKKKAGNHELVGKPANSQVLKKALLLCTRSKYAPNDLREYVEFLNQMSGGLW